MSFSTRTEKPSACALPTSASSSKMTSSSPFLHTLPMFTIASPFLSSSTQNPEKLYFVIFPLDKSFVVWYNCSCACGRGGIGIRARLRGVSSNGYGFKSRRPHQNLLSFARKVFLCVSFLHEHQHPSILLIFRAILLPAVVPPCYDSSQETWECIRRFPKGDRRHSSVFMPLGRLRSGDSPCNAKIKQQKNRPAAAAPKADCAAHSRAGSGIAHAISALSSPVCGARYTCFGYASSCENT